MEIWETWKEKNWTVWQKTPVVSRGPGGIETRAASRWAVWVFRPEEGGAVKVIFAVSTFFSAFTHFSSGSVCTVPQTDQSNQTPNPKLWMIHIFASLFLPSWLYAFHRFKSGWDSRTKGICSLLSFFVLLLHVILFTLIKMRKYKWKSTKIYNNCTLHISICRKSNLF